MYPAIQKTLFFTFFLMFGFPALSQTTIENKDAEEMNVDMPDETVETDVVDKRQLQLEGAVLYNRFEQFPNSLIGQMLVRYGMTKHLELRLLVEDGKERDKYIEETVQSNFPLAVGFKYNLLKDHNWIPDITLATTVKLPFTSREHEQNAYWSPILLLAFQNKLSEKWKLEYNGGAQQEAYSSEWVWILNGSVHYKLAKPLEIFVEYYAQFESTQDPQHNLGGGLAYQINNQFEVYASGGSSVDYINHNYFFSAGCAFRTH